ncbi:MAG: L-aspartate oxidase [Bdellovibrionaceae bacterium]|nr:L-aspartate oxidase [Bdellovibrionales bacterium]MCB9084749.1 L-aspartate oxidase [Pseudobdellovibrionaceae bacterium]
MAAMTDILVIGSGLAGLSFALKAAEFARVTLVTKSSLENTNTRLAQGGVAAVTSREDSLESHIRDTLEAGAGLCKEDVVRYVVEQGARRINDLTDWGVKFDLADSQDFALTREGGHSHRRILHIADQTGAGIHGPLLEKVKSHPGIQILENHLAIDLILNKQLNPYDFSPDRCLGAYVLNKETEEVEPVLARGVVLATGGAGKVYLYTSNWSGATGDGIAMAYRAGARVANLEFMQFHPTCLYHPHARNFLISEALRGEGGELVDGSGQAFMKKYHPSGSLAPRDIVARSIDAEMKRSGADCVYLNMTHHSREYLESRFPAIFQRCLELGIDISRLPIPVVPAAHYLCGGILTNLDGQTDLKGLYALGECAQTGLHGANRLASNSLLECLVFAHAASEHLKQNMNHLEPSQSEPPPWNVHDKEDSDELIVVSHMWDEIRRLMWNYVGIVRSRRRLERAQHRLTNILNEFQEYYSNFRTHSDIVELRNIALVADLTVKCALNRHESRGIHFSLDYPPGDLAAGGRDTILDPTVNA